MGNLMTRLCDLLRVDRLERPSNKVWISIPSLEIFVCDPLSLLYPRCLKLQQNMLNRQSTQQMRNNIWHYPELSRYLYERHTYHITIELINANNLLCGVWYIANTFFIIDFENNKYFFLCYPIAHWIGGEINCFGRERWVNMTLFIFRLCDIF